MADKSGLLVLTALSQAAAAGSARPLFASRAGAGLFPATAAGKAAAQRCCDEGLLTLEGEPALAGAGPALGGGAAGLRPAAGPLAGVGRITDKGLDYLLDQSDPRQVLEDFIRVLEERQTEVGTLLDTASRMHTSFEAVRLSVERVLRQVAPVDLKTVFRGYHDRQEATPAPDAPPRPALADAIVERLAGWAGSGTPGSRMGDYPLPDLYRDVAGSPGVPVSVGAFHDALRTLHEAGRVYLHPWTGPLYELPEPPFALLVGHLVAYYASPRPPHAANPAGLAG